MMFFKLVEEIEDKPKQLDMETKPAHVEDTLKANNWEANMDMETLKKANALRIQISSLESKLAHVEDALKANNWEDNFLDLIINEEPQSSIHGKEVFDFLQGYLLLKLETARREFELL